MLRERHEQGRADQAAADHDRDRERDPEPDPDRAFFLRVIDLVQCAADCAHGAGDLPDGQGDPEGEQPRGRVREDLLGGVVDRSERLLRESLLNPGTELLLPHAALAERAEDAEREQ
jgi:hypothetical protein